MFNLPRKRFNRRKHVKQRKLVGTTLAGALITALALPVAAAQVQPEGGIQPSPSMGQQPSEATSDAAITSAVRAELAKDSQLKAAKITVTTNQGRVALKGTAPSAAVRDRAQQVVAAVQGVTGVDNQLKVGSS